MRHRRHPSLFGGALLAALAASCGVRPPVAPARPASPTGVEHDICDGSPPLPHAPLSGILRNARCDQELYYSMSLVDDMLGVECTYCHAAKVEGQPERDFPRETHQKAVANWMSMHLMSAIKPADGSPLACGSCHTDEHGKPVAKILGTPRDVVKANEWMSLVMVKKFVARDGSKLRCKSCHVGTPGTPEFRKAVILHDDQLPPHPVAAPGTPGF
jgi:hypothetical protein